MMKKQCLVIITLLVLADAATPQTAPPDNRAVLRETFKSWTFQNVFNPFKSMRCEIRFTCLSLQLLQAWKSVETDQALLPRIDALINTMQQERIVVYLVEIDPGQSNLYTMDMKKIKGRTKLYLMDKSSGYKPNRVTPNLEQKLKSTQRYYGAMAFKVKTQEVVFQNISMETYFTAFDFLEGKDLKDEKAYTAQFNFHANGAPEADQPTHIPESAEIAGRLKGALSLVSLVTKKTL